MEPDIIILVVLLNTSGFNFLNKYKVNFMIIINILLMVLVTKSNKFEAEAPSAPFNFTSYYAYYDI